MDVTIDGKGLAEDVAVEEGTPPKSRFAMFTDDWLQLQATTAVAIDLPIAKGNFTDKYGEFSDSKTITGCIEAMHNVQGAAAEFGDPKTLRAQLTANPGLLATAEPPTEIYTHTVWMGQKIHTTADTLVTGFEGVLNGLSGLPPKDQVSNLKMYLFDATMGPIPLAKEISDEVGMLIKKLGKFEQKMNEYQQQLAKFTKSSSDMMAAVNKAVGAAEANIKTLERARDEAYASWKKFTIAAITSAVGCVLLGAALAPFTGGASLAVGVVAGAVAGGVLGSKAAGFRAAYNQAKKDLATQETEKRKKIQLRMDLMGLDTQMKLVAPAMAGFLKNLQGIQGIWGSLNADLITLGNSVNEGNIGTVPFLVKMKAQNAVNSWQKISKSAQQFTANSLIDYQMMSFGDELPAEAA